LWSPYSLSLHAVSSLSKVSGRRNDTNELSSCLRLRLTRNGTGTILSRRLKKRNDWSLHLLLMLTWNEPSNDLFLRRNRTWNELPLRWWLVTRLENLLRNMSRVRMTPSRTPIELGHLEVVAPGEQSPAQWGLLGGPGQVRAGP